MATTPEDVARYMLKRLDEGRFLWQETVVYEIKKEFGDDFVYLNDNGNYAIAKPVLRAFKKLSGADVIWERGERMWRRREKHDAPGRQQD